MKKIKIIFNLNLKEVKVVLEVIIHIIYLAVRGQVLDQEKQEQDKNL